MSRTKLRWAALGCVLAGEIATAPVAAQCGEWANPFSTSLYRAGRVLAAVSWDPDGTGPLFPSVVVGGSFTHADGARVSNVARWNNGAWQGMGLGFDMRVYALAVWDADGLGGNAPILVAGGDFTTTSSGGTGLSYVARFDGIAWRTMAGGMNGPVRSLGEWDPDGAGPRGIEVLAGGFFSSAGGVAADGAASWNGQNWVATDVGCDTMDGPIVNWDSDGDIATPSIAVAVGSFSQAAPALSSEIGYWDGVRWVPIPLDAGIGLVYSLATWDSDAAGPLPPWLIAGGSLFSFDEPQEYGSVIAWDGASWRPLWSATSRLTDFVFSLATWDSDGPGPQSPELYAGGRIGPDTGSPSTGIGRWDGASWNAVGTGVAEFGREVLALTEWDPDGVGGLGSRLVLAGDFLFAGPTPSNSISVWNGSSFGALDEGVSSGEVWGLTDWDPDGPGPVESEFVVSGSFRAANFQPLRSIAAWRGGQWQPFADGSVIDAGALQNWDPDGSGPSRGRLVVAGFWALGSQINGVAAWTGESWDNLGGGVLESGSRGSVGSMTTWTPDDAPGTNSRLVVAGTFDTAGATPATNIAWWDGATWHALGAGISGEIRSLTTWDPDGAGPQGRNVVAGGTFTNVGGNSANRIARWDGASWHALSTGMNNSVNALTTWDPDDDGPQAPRLIAGGRFTLAGGTSASRVASWQGTSWSSVGSGVSSTVNALHSWDPDLSGPLSPLLVAGGDFTTAGSVTLNRLAAWNGQIWFAVDSGPTRSVRAVSTLGVQPFSRGANQLVIGGEFTFSGNCRADRVALLDAPAPTVLGHPSDVAACGGATVSFQANAGGSTLTAIQWRRDGIVLQDDGRVSGAATFSLQIEGVTSADAGRYDCLFSNACGASLSLPAQLSITALIGDMNCDCFVTVADIGGFVLSITDQAAYAVQYPQCDVSNADVNDDGFVTVADIGPFVQLLTGN